MNLGEIQPNLSTVILAIALFADVQESVLIDDGQQVKAMEDGLKTEGLAILIFQPQALEQPDQTRGAAVLGYSTTVWVRTNPKIKVDSEPAWDPLDIEQKIITAVFGWSKDPARNDQGFQITRGMEPETDFMDEGNNSRLIRFTAKITFKG